MNLFEKYGGTPTVSKVVTNFYGKILSRPHLKAYFAGVPLPKLIQHQVRFMSQVMGQTPGTYNGQSMDMAHQRLNITAAHFGEVAQILETCLNEAYKMRSSALATPRAPEYKSEACDPIGRRFNGQAVA
jgi:truncated hemoglobin YjbI